MVFLPTPRTTTAFNLNKRLFRLHTSLRLLVPNISCNVVTRVRNSVALNILKSALRNASSFSNLREVHL